MSRLPKSREVIYIAGPFTAAEPVIIAHHCNVANAMARRIRAQGFVPFVPHSGLAGAHAVVCDPDESVRFGLPDLDWEAAMVECREILQRCDAVLMVEGWERSRGATEERALAKSQGIPVFDSFQELVAARLSVVRPAPAEQEGP